MGRIDNQAIAIIICLPCIKLFDAFVKIVGIMKNAGTQTENSEGTNIFAIEHERLPDSPAIKKLVSEELVIIRHLEDKDDLSSGRDTHLVEGQADKIQTMAREIDEEVRSQGYRAIHFCTSPRKRVVETVSLVKEALLKMDKPVRVITSVHSGLIDSDHGEFILPLDYQPGDRYEPFTRAWSVYFRESFEEDNKGYRFGDPVGMPNGEFKYPELAGYFKRFGENYAEFSIRLYSAAIDLADNLDRYGKNIKLIVMTHGAALAVYRDLEVIAEQMMEENFTFETGSLIDLCWARYNARVNRKSSEFGKLMRVSVRGLLDPAVVDKLREEVAFL